MNTFVTALKPTALRNGMLLALLAFSTPLTAGTMTDAIVEARQETQIWTTYALSPYLRDFALRVSVNDGIATLTGTVEEGVNRDLAKQIALGVSGIDKVDNQIVVKADYIAEPASERRYGELIDDATIVATVKSKLMWSQYTEGLSTEVDSQWGKVTLQGTADSSAARELATRLARNTHGVVSVDNRMTVTPSVASVNAAVHGTSKAAKADVTDSWINTKVRSTLIYSNNVNSAAITVQTSQGVVTLSGQLANAEERSLAIELAQNVRGVKRVESKALTL